jgi:hypothetical protein
VSNDTTIFTADSQQNIDAGVSYTFVNKAMLAFAYSHVDVYDPTSNLYFTDQPAAGYTELVEIRHLRTPARLDEARSR